MALFRPYQRPDQKPADEAPRPSRLRKAPRPAALAEPEVVQTAPVAEPTTTRQPVKKDRPTPTRKQAEKERMERLHPTLTAKEQKALERRRKVNDRNVEIERREAEPEKVLLRNLVDSRFHITEILLPAMLVIMALTLFVSQYFLPLVTYASLATWVLLAVAVADIALTWRRFRALLAERFPRASRRGLLLYMINRMVQVRSLRLPKPAVKRGEAI